MKRYWHSLGLVFAAAAVAWAQGGPVGRPAPVSLSDYLARLQSQPPPSAPTDKKFAQAVRAGTVAFASGDCKVVFSLVQSDSLGNIQQGFTPKQLEWFEKKVQKKYREVCYLPPAPDVRLVLAVTVTPDTYYGTRVVTNTSTNDNPYNGTVTDEDGETADVSGTVTTTSHSSVVVPYSFRYGIFTMSVMEPGTSPTWSGVKQKDIRTLHVFQQRGIYHWVYGLSWGRGKHPVRTLVQEAVKWMAGGGLNDPLQGYQKPKN